MSNFVEFKNFSQAMRRIEKYNINLSKESSERKKIKNLFESAEKSGFVVGYMEGVCKCGNFDAKGRVIAIKKDGMDYTQFREGKELSLAICPYCMKLGKLLTYGYGLTQEQIKKVINLVCEVKKNE